MAMAPGNQAITGGTVLRAPAIQSPNYVPGTTGWIIRQDGSAEFNAGTFRGSIEVGSLTGQHFWVNNPSTGDVIDVYNSANKLVFSIDATGRLVATSSVSTANVVINGANVFFEDTAQTPALPPFINGSLGPDLTSLNLTAGQPQHAGGGVNGSFITLNTGDTSASEWINVEQRGVQGAMVQTASSTNAGQLVHAGSYVGTTNASGHVVLSHGAGFTPTQIVITGTAPGGTFANLTCGVDSKTSTQFDTNWTIANTNAPFANSTITFDAVMFG